MTPCAPSLRPWCSFLLAALAALAVACSDPADDPAGSLDASGDADAATDAALDAAPPTPPAPAEVRGWLHARTGLHAHSVHSHDACDDQPFIDGEPNAACVDDLRRGACAAELSAVFLSEHATSMSEVAFEELLLPLHREGDRWLGPSTSLLGAACPNGSEVVFLPGAENALMPLALTRHADADDLHGRYRGRAVEDVEAFAAAGGVTIVNHSEDWTTEEIAALPVDGIEIYNLHANIDPKTNLAALSKAGPFLALGDDAPDPDLAPLGFFLEGDVPLGHWSRLVQQRRTVGVIAHDIHQNVVQLVGPFKDGDRLDSYRRVLGWFSDVLLVREVDADSLREALAEGRLYGAFDYLGRPDGFDAWVADASGEVVCELGCETPFAAGQVVRVAKPEVAGGLPDGAEPPEVRVRLLGMDADGGTSVLAEEGSDLTVPIPAAGVYRVEVRMVPRHLRPRLGTKATELADRDLPWIYANPFYLR